MAAPVVARIGVVLGTGRDRATPYDDVVGVDVAMHDAHLRQLVNEQRVAEPATLAAWEELRYPGDPLLSSVDTNAFFTAEAIGMTWSIQPLRLDALDGLELTLEADLPVEARLSRSSGGGCT